MTSAPSIPKVCGAARLVRPVIHDAGLREKTNGSANHGAPVPFHLAATAAPSPIPPSYSVRINRPLISLWTAAGILDCTEETVERDTECGRLEWAFNLARDPHSRRRCVRVFTREILDRKTGVKRNYSLPFVVNACFPASRASFRLREIAFAWHVSDGHIVGLFRQGLIQPVDPGASAQRPGQRYGRGKFPRITQTSLADFLTSRRIT
jgi:hypothetical protein